MANDLNVIKGTIFNSKLLLAMKNERLRIIRSEEIVCDRYKIHDSTQGHYVQRTLKTEYKVLFLRYVP